MKTLVHHLTRPLQLPWPVIKKAVEWIHPLVLLGAIGLYFCADYYISFFNQKIQQMDYYQNEFKEHIRPYEYSNALPFGRHLNTDKISQITPHKFKKMVMGGVPRKLHKRLERLLVPTLEISQKYQVDPFWVLAVMWTESHYNPKSISPVGAQGPMQIMPRTGEYLYKLHKNKGHDEFYGPHLPKSYKRYLETIVNIEYGVFYLKHLLQMFNNDPIKATVAYNMGPSWVRKRLKSGLPVGQRNQYLRKVLWAYGQLTAPFETNV